MVSGFLSKLDIRLPVIQAPMAGVSSPAMVAAVSAAGALGSFGHAYTLPEQMAVEVKLVRDSVGQVPLQINLFVQAPLLNVSAEQVKAALACIAPWFERVGLPLPNECTAPYAPSLEQQIEAALELRPRVLSSHLNPFPPDVIEAARARGILVAGSATNVTEALVLEAAGVDFIIAQSGEAGGHRGTFIGAAEHSMTGTLSLTRSIVSRCRVPIVAAGGIMDGAGIVAALALGAGAAQLGTAFLDTKEALTSRAHREALRADEHGNSRTRITSAFSGRPAQGLANGFIEHAARLAREDNWTQLAFPAQNKLTGALRAAGAKAGDSQVLAMWCGQAHALVRTANCEELLAILQREMNSVLANLQAIQST
jgi:nitronate monooxygenase